MLEKHCCSCVGPSHQRPTQSGGRPAPGGGRPPPGGGRPPPGGGRPPPGGGRPQPGGGRPPPGGGRPPPGTGKRGVMVETLGCIPGAILIFFCCRSRHRIVLTVRVALSVVINQECMLKVNAKEPEKAVLVTTPRQTL